MTEELISLESLSYSRNKTSLLSSIDLKVFKGENWVILGANGSGKTTLINLLYGYLSPTSGKIKIFGETFGETILRPIQKRIGILESTQQNSLLQKNLTVKEVLLTGLVPSIGFYHEPSQKDISKVESILKENLWISNPDQIFSTLSSGEKQKILLLRAIIHDPEILILDEPCSAMDIGAREEFLNLLDEKLHNRKSSAILITHRIEEISSRFTHVLLLKDGKKIFSGKIVDGLSSEFLSICYKIKLKVYAEKGRYFAVPE
ncbi:MAG: ATP-binding cassette domain-containing protein [Leptospiraceae bacterium]|nr:ATP-binding cassette domain-containing protein [Leptospiraceae bacterium]